MTNPDLELPVEFQVAFLRVPEKLNPGEHEGRVVNAEIDSMAVPELRIVKFGPARQALGAS